MLTRQAGLRSRDADRAATRLAPALALLLLAACGGSDSGTPANPLTSGQASCPRITLLAEGADLTRFRAGAARDLTAMTVDARIAGFDAVCDYASRERRALDVRVTPRFQAERGPAAEGRAQDLPWFVALSDAGDTTVLERQSFVTRLAFAANAPRANATGQAARLRLPIGDGVAAGNYIIRVSFQLTPEELALNRSRGPR
jgi:hypothetical protein